MFSESQKKKKENIQNSSGLAFSSKESIKEKIHFFFFFSIYKGNRIISHAFFFRLLPILRRIIGDMNSGFGYENHNWKFLG